MTPQVSESRELDKVIIRLPDGMRDKLKSRAADNNRSMNAEIVARLSESLEMEKLADDPAASADVLRPVLETMGQEMKSQFERRLASIESVVELVSQALENGDLSG
ncbi:MAG: Arc family DNA-binding protein, partial [Rhizobiales bacterium]|nr:Arc family DNA-binding protein [Hyphomicrobiales bacterium]